MIELLANYSTIKANWFDKGVLSLMGTIHNLPRYNIHVFIN